MPTPSQYALMSAESYSYYRNDGQQPITVGSGWDVLNTHIESDQQFAYTIFLHENANHTFEYVFAFRGTDSWDPGQGDAYTNINLGVEGIVAKQTRLAIEAVQSFIANEHVSVDHLSFTGHSL